MNTSPEMQNWLTADGVPDRRIGLAAGIIGGVVGMAAARYYWLRIAPDLFPDAALDQQPPTYLAGQRILEEVAGDPPDAASTMQLAEMLQWGYGVVLGATYGGTRTSTRWRDLAGGFWYGVRLWLGDELFTPLLHLREPPQNLPLTYHLKRLTAYHVYTFTTSAVTRVLYKLLAQDY